MCKVFKCQIRGLHEREVGKGSWLAGRVRERGGGLLF